MLAISFIDAVCWTGMSPLFWVAEVFVCTGLCQILFLQMIDMIMCRHINIHMDVDVMSVFFLLTHTGLQWFVFKW